MAECPFCQSSISEEMALYGGNCPNCLIQIPGEEAPTDPGVSQTAEVPRGSTKGMWWSGAAAAVVVFAGIGGWVAMQEPEAEPVVNLEAAAQIPLSMHEDLPFEPEPEPEVAQVGAKSSPAREAQRPSPGRAQLPGAGEPVAEGSVIPKAVTSDMSGSPLDAFSTVGVSPSARGPAGIVLRDPGKIEIMIRRVLDRGAKRLETCYNQRLKVDPGFRGAWDISLRVTRDGTADAVRVRTLRGNDSATAECIRREASRWTFQRVVEPYEISRTYRFGG